MSTSKSVALGGLLFLLGVEPSFAQGVYETPPAPNSSKSMPQPPDSAPPSARTLTPGSTGMQRMGTVGVTAQQPEPATAGTVRAQAPQ